jgi:hypothetical protein
VNDTATHDEQIAALNLVIDHLKDRKAHYKGITERVRIVLQSAWLLDESYIRVSVLTDALVGDRSMRPAGPRRS